MITIAHSPDADDFFMFWALRHGSIETLGETFSFQEFDTQELNQTATNGQFDVVAISAATYPAVSNNYLILPHGASIGRNFGPVLVSKRKMNAKDLNSCTVGIPGRSTTAASLLMIIAPQAKTIEIPLVPYEAVFTALESGEVDAAVLIHEGQINYSGRNLHPVISLGEWWYKETDLPLPLGINVIRKSLGIEGIKKISGLIQQSIEYALSNRKRLIDELLLLNRKRGIDLSREKLDRYLSLFANEDTLTFKQDAKLGLERLLKMLTPKEILIEYV